MRTVFDRLDNLTQSYRGVKPFSFFWNIHGWRQYVGLAITISAFMWFILGFDSTVEQIIPMSLQKSAPCLAFALPNFLFGKISLPQLIEQTYINYGLGTHWSAVIIYGLFFIGISKHLELHRVKKSLNFTLTSSFTLLTISVFELGWMYSYAVFQNQPWVFNIRHSPFLMNIIFLFFGVWGVLYTYLARYVKDAQLHDLRFNLTKLTILLFILSTLWWLLWIYYPFSVNHITVGSWTNSNFFPQTQYTINSNPNLYAGYPYHVEDNSVHFFNIGVKILLTCSMYRICKFRCVKR